MKKTICWLFISLLICSSCSADKKDTSDPKGCDSDELCDVTERSDMSGYEGFMDNEHQFVEVPMSDFLLKLDAGATGIYYFGYTTCPWCVEAVPIMNEVAKEFDVKIFYIDKKAETTKEEDSKAIEARIPDKLDKDDEGNPHLYVPYVITIKEGEITSYHTGTVDSHDAHERKMTDEEKAELKKRYQEMFQTIK